MARLAISRITSEDGEPAALILAENEIWRSVCRGELDAEWRSESLLASQLGLPLAVMCEAVDNLVGAGLLNRFPGLGIRLSDSAIRCSRRTRTGNRISSSAGFRIGNPECRPRRD